MLTKSNRVPIVLQQAVMHSLRSYLTRANQLLASDYPEPALNYRQRGTIAGTAHLSEWEIRLNPILLIENGQSFVDSVVPHELAHLLTFRHFGRVPPHGKEWRWMMETILGVEAKRTHHFAVQSVQSKTFIYRCHCNEKHHLTIRRHNKVQRGESEYLCRRCKAKLSWDK